MQQKMKAISVLDFIYIYMYISVPLLETCADLKVLVEQLRGIL